MSLTDDFCKSGNLREEEQKLCFDFALYIQELMVDLNNKGFLRSELRLDSQQDERMNFMKVLWNVRKITGAFNQFLDIYVDKIKPDSKQRLKKVFELEKPYGLTEENLRYMLYSEMIFVFLQNIEEFRNALLFILKLPIRVSKKRSINGKTTIGTLLKSLTELRIRNSERLNVIDCRLRNGLSHGLFWIDETKEQHFNRPHLHYVDDITFRSKEKNCIDIADLYLKTRTQSIYTNCLLNVIGDWFS